VHTALWRCPRLKIPFPLPSPLPSSNIYGQDKRKPLAGGSASQVLFGWSTPIGLAATSDGFYVTETTNAAGKLLLARSAYYTSASGWESLVVADGLRAVGQVCGKSGNNVFLITHENTKITAVDVSVSPATVAFAVTGLSTIFACSVDEGGTGDLIFADGADIYVLSASALGTMVDKSSLTPVANVGSTANAPGTATIITSLRGNTTSKTFFVFKVGCRGERRRGAAWHAWGARTGRLGRLPCCLAHHHPSPPFRFAQGGYFSGSVQTGSTVVRIDAASTPASTTPLWSSITASGGLKYPTSTSPWEGGGGGGWGGGGGVGRFLPPPAGRRSCRVRFELQLRVFPEPRVRLGFEQAIQVCSEIWVIFIVDCRLRVVGLDSVTRPHGTQTTAICSEIRVVFILNRGVG